MRLGPTQTSQTDRHAARPFLAADVGGTHVRIGLVHGTPDPAQPVAVLAYQTWPCAEHAGLGEAIETFVSSLGGERVVTAVIASAGHQLADGRLISVNLPWPIDLGQLRRRLHLDELRLVNDFEALAHAAPYFEANQMLQLSGPARAEAGPVLALGPGTGFGSALWMPTRSGPMVLASEAGQASLAVGDEREQAVVRELRRDRSHVSIEHALSGPGLVNLYRALCALDGQAAACATPREVAAAAVAGSDRCAHEALAMFCGLLGSVTADLALAYGAQAACLAGGLLPGIRDFLIDSRFVERFLDKGVMREALERIPVRLIEHGRLGVLGAAACYLSQHAASKPH